MWHFGQDFWGGHRSRKGFCLRVNFDTPPPKMAHYAQQRMITKMLSLPGEFSCNSGVFWWRRKILGKEGAFQGIMLRIRTFSENSRKLWLFPGTFWGFPRKTPGKSRDNCWKTFPNCDMLQILGFGAPGKANLPGTLGRHCQDLVPTFRAGRFLKSTVPAFSSFSDFLQTWLLQNFLSTFFDPGQRAAFATASEFSSWSMECGHCRCRPLRSAKQHSIAGLGRDCLYPTWLGKLESSFLQHSADNYAPLLHSFWAPAAQLPAPAPPPAPAALRSDAVRT